MDLHWLPVHQRATFKILILTYQAYHETAPQYLCDLIVPYANTSFISNNMLLIAPLYYYNYVVFFRICLGGLMIAADLYLFW